MNDRQMPLEQKPTDLQVINVRGGGALVKVGDEQISLPMLSSIEREMDKVNGMRSGTILPRSARLKESETKRCSGCAKRSTLDGATTIWQNGIR